MSFKVRGVKTLDEFHEILGANKHILVQILDDMHDNQVTLNAERKPESNGDNNWNFHAITDDENQVVSGFFTLNDHDDAEFKMKSPNGLEVICDNSFMGICMTYLALYHYVDLLAKAGRRKEAIRMEVFRSNLMKYLLTCERSYDMYNYLD